MARVSPTQAALGEVYRRLARGRALAVEAQRRFAARPDTHSEHYADGRLAGLDQSMATLEQVWAEVVEHAGGNPNEHPLIARHES